MLDFNIQGNVFIIIVSFFLLAVLVYNYTVLLRAKAPLWRFIMLFTRSLTLVIILFLLVNPILNYFGRRTEKPLTAVFIDDSSSIKFHLDKSNKNPVDLTAAIVEWADSHETDMSLFTFGNSLRPVKSLKRLNFTDTQTDFSDLPGKMSEIRADHNILITDGIATSGLDLASLNFSDVNPIYTIAVGAAADEVDVSIDRIDAPASVVMGDSLDITVSLKSVLNEQTSTRLEILNESGKSLYDSVILLQPGSGYQSYKLRIPSENFTEFMTARISAVKDELFAENNQSSFNIKILSARENLLIITGALSYNTAYLKNLIRELPRAEVHHLFRKSASQWNDDLEKILQLSPTMIIMDDFPSESGDRNMLNRVVDYSKTKLVPLIYFEGPSAGMITASQLSSEFQLTAREVQHATEVSLVRPLNPYLFIDFSQIENVPPQRRNLTWSFQNGGSLLEFSDGLPAIWRFKGQLSFTAVFMPQLAQLSLKNSTTEYSGILERIVFDLMLTELLSENNIAVVESDQTGYDFGDPVAFTIRLNEAVDAIPKTVVLKLTDDKGEIVDEIPARWHEESGSFTTDYLPRASGNLSAWSEIEWDNGENTKSDSINISIQDINVEYRNLSPNLNGLNRIAENTGGTSGHINQLESILNAVKITPVKKDYEFHFSAVLTQKYWIIIILLLAIEWWIRKRNGLL